ncbi:MAG: hypothetical protein ISR65_04770 [Bacteriovoracaceae bacterium]|nr:hypothetical protein [Bacteriovoracaceae bacterium]
MNFKKCLPLSLVLSTMVNSVSFAAESIPGKPNLVRESVNASHQVGAGITTTYAGNYVPAEQALSSSFSGVSLEKFGTFTLTGLSPEIGAAGESILVRESQYVLQNGKVGVRVLPVVDSSPEDYPLQGNTASGEAVSGSELVDQALEADYGFSQSASEKPIFGIIAYYHPELHTGNFEQLTSSSLLKTENGITHMGAYIGDGKTRNSPYTYHQKKWKVKGYPANLYSVKYDGASAETFNQNFIVTIELLNALNGGVIFPDDYKRDYMRTFNLQAVLDFYRGWLDPNWTKAGDDVPFIQKLKNDDSYSFYCAEHITVSLNSALNIPQNEAGYVSIWGQEAGRDLWQKAKSAYKEITGNSMPSVASFKPLWKKVGISAPTKHKGFGESMAWPAESTSDLIVDFIEQYARFIDVGPALSSAVILGFAKETTDRMGIDQNTYFGHAVPIVQSIVKSYATFMTGVGKIATTEGYQRYLEGLKQGLQKVKIPAEMAELIITPLQASASTDFSWVKSNASSDKEAIWSKFKKSIATALEKARHQETGDDSRGQDFSGDLKYYSPPAIVHRIVNGFHPRNKYVQFTAIGTVMDAKDVQSNGNTQQDPIEEPVVVEPVEEPVVEEPVVIEPVEEPVVEEPFIVDEPVEEPVFEEPVVEEPFIVEEPTVEPAVEKPADDDRAGPPTVGDRRDDDRSAPPAVGRRRERGSERGDITARRRTAQEQAELREQQREAQRRFARGRAARSRSERSRATRRSRRGSRRVAPSVQESND